MINRRLSSVAVPGKHVILRVCVTAMLILPAIWASEVSASNDSAALPDSTGRQADTPARTSVRPSGRLALAAGLLDEADLAWEASYSAMLNEGDDSVFLRPRQMLEQENDNFGIWIWDCYYPVVKYFFYANPGYIDIHVSPQFGVEDVNVFLRTDGPYPQGANVLNIDQNGPGGSESGSYRNTEPQLFMLLIGFNTITSCDPQAGFYVDPVTVSLSYTPYEWDIRLTGFTANTSYPDNSATVTATYHNYSPDTLIGGWPWYYETDLFLNYTPNACTSTPPNQSADCNAKFHPNTDASRQFVINGPRIGLMDVYVMFDGYDVLPVKYPSYQGNCSSPLQLLWSVNLTGNLTIRDSILHVYQPLARYECEIVRKDGAQSVVLATVTTDANGAYATTIPSGDYLIHLGLDTDQHPLMYAVKRTQSPNEYFSGKYQSLVRATVDSAVIDLELTSDTDVGNTALYSATRLIMDLLTADSLISLYTPFSYPGMSLNNEIPVYMDSTNQSITALYRTDDRPFIIMNQSQVYPRAGSHELGHAIMYILQDRTFEPETPFDGLDHAHNSYTDEIFAFNEGFAIFIHSSCGFPEAIIVDGGDIETNDWWQGESPPPAEDRGELVEGCVASIFYDLCDDASTPAERVTLEDDGVRNPSYMMQILLDCIYNFRSSDEQTRSLPLFAERLVRDTGASWYRDPAFTQVRTAICDIFADHHYHVDQDFCRASAVLDDDIPEETLLPATFAVAQNYPNPFNAGTIIPFQTPAAGACRFEVYNTLGQVVHSELMMLGEPGEYTIRFDDYMLNNLSTGVYFYSLTFDDRTISRKMVFLK